MAQVNGIIDPPIDDLLEKVDSKYALVVFASQRARQINDYYTDLHDGNLFDNVGPLVDASVDSCGVGDHCGCHRVELVGCGSIAAARPSGARQPA